MLPGFSSMDFFHRRTMSDTPVYALYSEYNIVNTRSTEVFTTA